ncbi:MAG: hypothetical protein FJ206_14730 [Gemmatimonadetes bacterium]|nr:hypothetical protein [Gemmatimonadota bacterium]
MPRPAPADRTEPPCPAQSRWGWVVGGLWLIAGVGHPISAQTSGRIGLGLSYIEYDGFLATGAAVVTPSLRLERGGLAVVGRGSWARFESGRQVGEASVGASAFAGRGRWRVEGAGTFGLSKYSESGVAGHALATGRLHFTRGREGLWTAVTTGATGDGSSTPVEVAVAGWLRADRLSFTSTATVGWVDRGRLIDLAGSLRWRSDAGVELEGRAGNRWTRPGVGRLWENPRGAYGEASLTVPLGSRLAFAVSGGTFGADPVRRSVGARYLSTGLSIRALGRELRRPNPTANPSAPIPSTGIRFLAEGSGPTRRLTARLDRPVQRVEIMADFTDWEVVQLARTGPTTWRLEMTIEPGVYRFNVRIDGGEWLVPDGVRAESNEFGGRVGVVIVR